ncbi:ribbon-helix-helix domain-containing protein [Fischerella sp. PCC 9605]|uniref:ribbon-helix-helix domain-containing protein n=1 Tax=Fischerella sp. PCC 9605 TaxID=1173024 RepID=UPI0004BC80AF|nr:ribbon-helix-helix domain-containing protein [Fischerella sp. PCC 9605]
MPLTVENRKTQLNSTVDPKIKAAVKELAKKENRNVSNLVEYALKLYLEQHAS